MADQQLRIRVTDDQPLTGHPVRKIEVLDANGNVLGDLSKSVGDVTYRMGIGSFSILTIELAAERASVDSIELPGSNAPKRSSVTGGG